MKAARKKLRLAIRAGALLLLAALLCWFALPFLIPLPPRLAENPAASPVFLDRNGRIISHLTLVDSTRSTPVSLDEIPQDLIDCTLAAEDKRFYSHGGIDILATFRAGWDFLRKRRVTSGASTITQQLVKISSPRGQRKLTTKVREALLARRLEMTWDKQRILIAYLNRLDYGNLRIGPTEAARFYFQKPLADLSLAEAALLAGLPQAPSRLDPLSHPKRATVRRNTVLQRLAGLRPADAHRVRDALTESMTLRPLREKTSAPWLSSIGIHSGNEIRTTLDLKLQQTLETIVREETAKLKDANLRHAAVVVIHNPTGEVLALVSSADWNDRHGGQINGSLAPRSPGSTLKPFTYLLAMARNGRLPCSILADIPTPLKTPQGISLPENYDRTYRGPVTLRTALACSLNLPALRELNLLGGPVPLVELLQQMGISTLGNDPSFYGLGLTLGNAPVRLLELTNAYATLARQGRHLPVTLFPDAQPPIAESRLPFSEKYFYLLSHMLSDKEARAPSFPPGGPLDFPFPCAVKTGTSSDFRDNWCMGFTPEFTVGVWAGNFEQQPMKGISGIAGAGPIFHRSMTELYRTATPTWYPLPAGLTEITIDFRTGKRLRDEEFPANPYARKDLTDEEHLPLMATTADYDASGKALIPLLYSEWYRSPHNHRLGELLLDPVPASPEPLRITSPANNSTFLLDPEIPSGSNQLRPVANLPDEIEWSSETLKIQKQGRETIILLQVGTHLLTALDKRSGTTQSIRIHVKSL